MLIARDGDEGMKRDRVNREFAARIVWDGDGEGRAGVVKVEWADGGVTVVEGEVLGRLVGG